jgi:hypothetical protein
VVVPPHLAAESSRVQPDLGDAARDEDVRDGVPVAQRQQLIGVPVVKDPDRRAQHGVILSPVLPDRGMILPDAPLLSSA